MLRHAIDQLAPTGIQHAAGGGQVTDYDESVIVWRKSTASNSGACVEVATVGGTVLIRDSADPHGPLLKVPAPVWSTFTAFTSENNFDNL